MDKKTVSVKDAINQEIDKNRWVLGIISQAERVTLYRAMFQHYEIYGKVPRIKVNWKQQ